MSTWNLVEGLGDTITCDSCNDITENWFSSVEEARALCRNCVSQEPMSWSEVADFTHAKQLEVFNWCACEDRDDEDEETPYSDCPDVTPAKADTIDDNLQELLEQAKSNRFNGLGIELHRLYVDLTEGVEDLRNTIERLKRGGQA